VISDRAKLAGILAVGLGLRLLFLRVHQTIEGDGVLYASVAEHLAQSGRLMDVSWEYHTFYPPGYPALVAPVYALVGDSHRAGQIVSLAAGMALIALVWVLGRRLAGGSVGLIAAALTAIYPPLAHQAVSVHTESMYAALLCLSVLVGLELVERPSVGMSALGGALVGALYLFRPEGLLLGAGVVWAVAIWIARGERPARIGARAAGFVLALSLLVVPYVAYLHQMRGAWLLSGKGLSYRIAESPHEADAIAFGQPRPWQGLRTEGAVLAERYLRNFFRQEGVIAEAMSILALGLAAVGLAGAVEWRKRLAAEGVVLGAFVPLLLYPAFEVVPRWTEPYMVVVFVYVARGIVWVAGQARIQGRSEAVAWLFVALLAVRYAPQLAIPLRYTPSFENVEQRAAGLWIRDRFGPGTTVMSRPPEIAYYARARWVKLPYRGISGVIAEARRAGVTFIVIDELHMRRLRPDLLPLLEGPPPPGLTLVHQTDEFPQRRVRVLAVAPS